MLLPEELRKKRYKKSFKRKKEIARRLKCHGNNQSCEFIHIKVESKKVEIKKEIKKSFWEKIKELWKKIINNWLMI